MTEPVKKGPSFLTLALGCGTAVLAFIVILSFLFWLAKDTLVDMMNTSTTQMVSMLEIRGFKKYTIEGTSPSLTSPKSLKAVIKIETAPEDKTIYWGHSLSINVPCDKDIAFIGTECNINADIKGTLIYIGNSKLTIAKGVKVDKVYTYSGAVINNNGQVKNGITLSLDEFFKQPSAPPKEE